MINTNCAAVLEAINYHPYIVEGHALHDTTAGSELGNKCACRDHCCADTNKQMHLCFRGLVASIKRQDNSREQGEFFPLPPPPRTQTQATASRTTDVDVKAWKGTHNTSKQARTPRHRSHHSARSPKSEEHTPPRDGKRKSKHNKRG